MTSTLPTRDAVLDFLPLAQRVLAIDPASAIRLRGDGATISAFVRLPYDVLAGRTIESDPSEPFDLTVEAAAFVEWVDRGGSAPQRRDALWLAPLPPRAGWRRIDVVPDHEIREIVRSGALLAQGTATRAGQESLLGSVVLHASRGDESVEVPLGPLSALTKMGFLPRDAQAAIDVARGWIRIAAPFGSTFVASGQSPLGMLGLS
jgi:hypothetical protein